VSFGLFVPPRILQSAKYGGLNVHPSLLPDLRGAAPIEHAILSGRKYTGVSVQTLHPQHFDHGVVLAQTPAPGIPIGPDTTATALEEELADAGAQTLVDVLKSGKYRAPQEDVAWYTGPTVHAPKIVKNDRSIDFATHSLKDILRIQNALRDPWCVLTEGDRVILHKIIRAGEVDRTPTRAPGLYVQQGTRYPVLKAACGNIGHVLESTFAGGKAGHGNVKLMRVLPRWEDGNEA
jgi:methionyl-tRNA formyltransferase